MSLSNALAKNAVIRNAAIVNNAVIVKCHVSQGDYEIPWEIND
jgi:hypothetical protein